MRWDRTNGGCVPGLITGTTAPGYTGGDTQCTKDGSKHGATLDCKYDSTALETFRTQVQTCWSNTQAITAIDYMISHYCNPELTDRTLSDGGKSDLETKMNTHCQGNTT